MKKYFYNLYHESEKIKNEINFRHFLIFFFPVALILGSAIVNTVLLFTSLIFVYDLIKNTNNYNHIFKETWIKIFIIFWIYIIINSFFSSDQFASFKNSFFQIRYILLILFIYQNLNQITFRILIYIIFACLCFVSVDNNVQFFTGLDIFGFPAEGYGFDVRSYNLDKAHIYQIGRLSGPFKDELIPGAYLSKLSFIVLVYFFIRLKQSTIRTKIIFVFGYLFLLESILITGERTSSLIFLTLSLVIIIFNFNIKKSILFLSILLGILILLIQQNNFLKLRVNDTLNIMLDYKNSSYGRLTSSASSLWRQNVFMGVGLKNYRVDCLKLNDPIPNHKFQYCSSHPHNTILELLSETGLIGTIIFLAFLISFFKYIYFKIKHIKNRDIKFFCFSLLLNLFIIIFPILPSGSLFTTWNASIFWLIFGIILLLTKIKKIEIKSN